MDSEAIPQNVNFLDDRLWRNLLRDIRAKHVIPVIGPELVTITGEDGVEIPLYSHLASELVQRLKVQIPIGQPCSLNNVACAWRLSGGSSMVIYDELRGLIEDLQAPPSRALLDLASITDFGLYISTTFDPLLGEALRKTRPGFDQTLNSIKFSSNCPTDLPQQAHGPILYHILGTHDTYPDFAVWEEDYIEYICGLLRAPLDNVRLLFDQLRTKDLLLIGSPFNDWLVRFFLQVAKGKRFSEQRQDRRNDYVVDEPATISPPTIFFYQQQVGSTRIIPGNPRVFATELAGHWNERYAPDPHRDIFRDMSVYPPRGSVFISYSRDDEKAAISLARGLMDAQIPVWLDKGRLLAGENYERRLEQAVKQDASFFISLISKATESNQDRFVHTERSWAAHRHMDGFVFYIPVQIEEVPLIQHEPEVFRAIQRETLLGGQVNQAFASHMQRLVTEFQNSGQPRG